jgi:hypothetical protein
MENAQSKGVVAPAGELSLQVIRAGEQLRRIRRVPPGRLLSFRELLFHGFPRKDLPEEVNAWRASNCRRLVAPWLRLRSAKVLGLPYAFGQLALTVIRSDGRVEELGLASLRVVTTAGVNFLVDALQNLTEPENFKFHGIGTGTNAEAVGDTALQTELTTQYNPDNTRATGSQTEGAANVYRTVGTNTVDSAVAITEHGILTQAATGGGTLLDRSQFSAVNLASGDSLQSTYDLTLTAGS